MDTQIEVNNLLNEPHPQETPQLDGRATAEPLAADRPVEAHELAAAYDEDRLTAKAPESGLPTHPVCALFPLMDEPQLRALTEDVRASGLLHPIVIHEGELVDGRNRLEACHRAGVEPRRVNWRDIYTGPMSISEWIVSINVKRRHMKMDQITMAHVAARAWQESERAKQRQIEARDRGKEGGRGNAKTLPMNSSEGILSTDTGRKPEKDHSGDVRKILAIKIGTTEHKTQQALNIEKIAPEIGREVIQGRLSLREAEKRAKEKSGALEHSHSESANAKAAEPEGSKARFDMEGAIKRAMRSVDKELGCIPNERRDEFINELIKTVESVR